MKNKAKKLHLRFLNLNTIEQQLMNKHFINMTLYDSKVSVNKTILCSVLFCSVRSNSMATSYWITILIINSNLNVYMILYNFSNYKTFEDTKLFKIQNLCKCFSYLQELLTLTTCSYLCICLMHLHLFLTFKFFKLLPLQMLIASFETA